MPDVGEIVALTLDVGGADTDTEVAAVAVHPVTGAATVLDTAPDAPPDRSRWGASLTVTAAGEWLVLWTVTGSGAGQTTDAVLVGPGAGPVVGRAYADTAQLAEHLRAAPPPGARGLLVRASRAVDELLLTAVYATDDDGLPADPAVAAALAEATCAQVEWWGETGDEAGSGSVAALAGAQIGTVRLPGGADGQGIAYAPAAVSALRRAGLLTRGPRILDGAWGPLR